MATQQVAIATQLAELTTKISELNVRRPEQVVKDPSASISSLNFANPRQHNPPRLPRSIPNLATPIVFANPRHCVPQVVAPVLANPRFRAPISPVVCLVPATPLRLLSVAPLRLLSAEHFWFFSRISIGNFFFAGARIFFQSLDAAIFLFTRVSQIPTESPVLPVISTNDRLTLVLLFFMVFPSTNQTVLDHLNNVDSIIYAMGSLFTLICPSLVLRGIGESISSRSCPKVCGGLNEPYVELKRLVNSQEMLYHMAS
ncbi:uncharacterized protein LOC131008141 [Salvia miltiorrhiza]|uniref:uncharacterized protein LOC131008141 n=1 Tax=Salvia miltiorrhiza TaxID=226208 RepID=UPI0025AD49F8|nr:uncharacterized protein LOC131008141 [Salvia miltiorrhiza]